MPKLSDLPVQALAKAQQSVGKAVGKYLERGSAELHYARKMFEAGALKLESPQHIAALVSDIRRWGEFGMIPAVNARRRPNRVAV
ncbi:MAG TPA: acyl-CoA synthetase, partial [Mycobacterium sp.]|nr:acyl-CoA synthetase [Mycobacterium sp.]